MAGDAGIDGSVRPASLEDFPQVLGMLKRFFDSTGYSDLVEFDSQSLLITLTDLVNSGVLLVVEKEKLIGVAGAVLYSFYFNRNHLTAQEVFWWVDPEYRGVGKVLFQALKQEVKKRGAKSLSMISLETSPEWIGEFYKKHGLRPSERSYIGRI